MNHTLLMDEFQHLASVNCPFNHLSFLERPTPLIEYLLQSLPLNTLNNYVKTIVLQKIIQDFGDPGMLQLGHTPRLYTKLIQISGRSDELLNLLHNTGLALGVHIPSIVNAAHPAILKMLLDLITAV
jgi:hypothetical protein